MARSPAYWRGRVTCSGICARKARSTTLARPQRACRQAGRHHGRDRPGRDRHPLKLAAGIRQRPDPHRLVALAGVTHERHAALVMAQQEVDCPFGRRIPDTGVIDDFFHGFSTSLSSTVRHGQSSIRASDTQLTKGWRMSGVNGKPSKERGQPAYPAPETRIEQRTTVAAMFGTARSRAPSPQPSPLQSRGEREQGSGPLARRTGARVRRRCSPLRGCYGCRGRGRPTP
jgi:hypothetical protein